MRVIYDMSGKIDEFAEEFSQMRDEAFIDFVKTGNLKKVLRFCRKYGVEIPKDETVLKVGVYKAVQCCTEIPTEIKDKAALLCLKMGYSPMMKPGDYDMEDEDE